NVSHFVCFQYLFWNVEPPCGLSQIPEHSYVKGRMVGEEHGDFYDSGGCLIGYKEGRFRWRMSRIDEPPMKSDPEERFKVEIDCVQLRQVGKTIKRPFLSSFLLFDKFDNRVDPLPSVSDNSTGPASRTI